MLNSKKIIALVLTFALLFVTGCQKQTVSTNSNDVVLRWVLPGNTTAESQVVFDEFNKQLKEKFNVKIKFDILSFSDFAQKWQLMQAAKEKVDIVWTGYVVSFPGEVKNGSYMALDGLLDTTGADLKKTIPDWAWQKESFSGKVYAIPNMQQMNDIRSCMFTLKEVSDKYMDKEKIIKANSTLMRTQKGYDAITEYLDTLSKNGEIRKGVSTGSFPHVAINQGMEMIDDPFVIKVGDEKCAVYNKYELPESKILFKTMSEWYKKGYILKEISTIDSKKQYETKIDGNTVWSHGYYKDIEVGQSAGAGVAIDALPLAPEFYISSTAAPTATAIVAVSEYPELAMKVLDYLNTEKGKDLYNLLVYGFEGKHYTKVADNRIKAIKDDKKNDLYGMTRWVVGNTFIGYETTSDPQNWNNYIQNEVHASAMKSKLLGFKPDVSSIRNEMVNISSVKNEYLTILYDGVSSDYEKEYNAMISKMKASGSDKVIETLQTQIDSWLHSK
jgi:putative aldouronate transport system substrate-binding protein